MKKFASWFLGIFLFVVLVIGTVFFFKPQIFINPETVSWVINKSGVFKSWSWREAQIKFKWNGLWDRDFSGDIQDLCIDFNSDGLELNTCLDQLSWNLNFDVSWFLNFKLNSIIPVTVRSDSTSVVIKESTDSRPTDDSPPDIKGYWNLLWSEWIPSLDIVFKNIKVVAGEKTLEFSLNLLKSKDDLTLGVMDFNLVATPRDFTLTYNKILSPPDKFKGRKTLNLSDIKLYGEMKESGIPLHLTAKIGDLEAYLKTIIGIPLKGSFSTAEVRKDILSRVEGKISISDIQKFVHDYMPSPYDELPAPLNVMNGGIDFTVNASDIKESQSVLLKGDLNVSLQGDKQFLIFSLNAQNPINVLTFERGLLEVGIDFDKVAIQLPRLSKTSAPPQFLPDGRFKKDPNQKKQVKKAPPINLDLVAKEEEALHIRSNLLDEPLRLNFDLKIREGELDNGFLKILPLKTSVFKRPVHVRDMFITFKGEEKILNGTIRFPLPEYKINMNVEGPLTGPRYTFESDPPLPQNDIYAVLLFGRPLADLSPEDKTSAGRTNKVLSQGLLSLSVLYFLSGSPIEYIGLDPDSERATAQVGLGSKNSLRVGAGGDKGVSTGIRRSLGKGWYLDTSVQNSGQDTERSRDYGVLLERIIAY